MVKEDNFAADIGLEPVRGLNLGDGKPFWEKPAGLLAETDDRC